MVGGQSDYTTTVMLTSFVFQITKAEILESYSDFVGAIALKLSVWVPSGSLSFAPWKVRPVIIFEVGSTTGSTKVNSEVDDRNCHRMQQAYSNV